jgi:hypothetical protein
MNYMMAPLEAHSDDGFGAVGDAFYHAAQSLAKASDDNPIFFEDLPEIFLVRHASELFLKSGIIIHRRLRLPYGPQPVSSPKPFLLTADGNWKALYRAHDLAELYWYWKKLVIDHKDGLLAITKHKPDMGVPSELDGWIAALGVVDPNSDYFRYPVSKNAVADKEKSPFKEVATLVFPSDPDAERVRALVVKDKEDNIVQMFAHDSSTNKDLLQTARQAAEMLSNFHAMMRFEFTGGW